MRRFYYPDGMISSIYMRPYLRKKVSRKQVTRDVMMMGACFLVISLATTRGATAPHGILTQEDSSQPHVLSPPDYEQNTRKQNLPHP